MRIKRALICSVVITAVAYGSTITVDTGASTQNVILTGEGPVTNGSGTFGTFYEQDGACTAVAGTTTCTLSGALAAGGSPGFTSGTYSLITTFATSDVGPIQDVTSTTDPGSGANSIVLSFIAPDLSQVLDLNTGSGTFVVPLIESGNLTIAGDSYSEFFSSTTCAGTPVTVCDPAHVGLVSGSVIEGPITISDEFEAPTPEPRFSALMLSAILLLSVVLIRKKMFPKLSHLKKPVAFEAPQTAAVFMTCHLPNQAGGSFHPLAP